MNEFATPLGSRSTAARPWRILLAVDSSEHSLTTARFVRDLPLPADSEVIALAALPPHHWSRPKVLLTTVAKVEAVLHDRAYRIEARLLHGYLAESWVDFADKHPHDLLVVNARGASLVVRRCLRNPAHQTAEYACGSVLVLQSAHVVMRHVLLAIDGSPHARQATSLLARLPLPTAVQVHVLHVATARPRANPAPAAGEESEGHTFVAEAVETLKAAGLNTRGICASGDVTGEIGKYVKANAIDLVVVGSRGASADRGWLLGRVSHKLVHHAECSVLIVRQAADS